MRKKLLATAIFAAALATASAENRITLFDGQVFYDGYLVKNHPNRDVEDGVLRITTYQYARRLTDEQLNQIGTTLSADIKVKVHCDNYDRICSINLALVPKGQTEYDPDEVQRIELGRFITPFMDKNKTPDTVPYAFNLDHVSYILCDAHLREQYDLWMELEIFGVPYAAQQQISGCEGRNDVFAGYFDLVTDEPAAAVSDHVLVPVTIRQPDWRAGDFYSYKGGDCDELGIPAKTYTYEVPQDVEDAQLFIVTSNHGANSGGEEYNRRWHYIYIDGAEEPALTYMPGRTSCEPFRKYNTQANGIYGYTRMSDRKWQSFSNWCPGDVIDNRVISLGAVKAGTHTVKISVPDARFQDDQGKIPVSIFFQGLGANNFPAAVTAPSLDNGNLAIAVSGGTLRTTTAEGVMGIEVRDLQGRIVAGNELSRTLDVSTLPSGIYLVNVEMMNGVIETQKVKF